MFDLIVNWALGFWITTVVISLFILIVDFYKKNSHIKNLMKVVWILNIIYSGPLGLAVYWYSGRKEIGKDTLWKRAWRSDAHCYSGCGGGEIVGVFITIGVFALGNLSVSVVTFSLAYVFGYLLTVGPLIQEGMKFKAAVKDALYSETASITVMEITAVSIDLWLSAGSNLFSPVFWIALIISLTIGYFAAYPVNILLLKGGIKKGMSNPAKI